MKTHIFVYVFTVFMIIRQWAERAYAIKGLAELFLNNVYEALNLS